MAELVLVENEVENARFKDIFDPLAELSDQELYAQYRFDREGILWLSGLLNADLGKNTDRNRPIAVHIQICVALRYLASNSFQQVISDTFGISQPSVSRIVTDFLGAVNSRLDVFIRFPSAIADVREAQRQFFEIAGFPEVVGCVDGSHIRITSPSIDEDDYINRKGFHSLNVLAVCDHRYKFTYLIARWAGRTHDSFILNNSDLLRAYEAGQLNGLILGDSGFSVKQLLMVPYRDPQ